MEVWLLDRLEENVKTRQEVFTPRQVAAALQHEPRINAVCELYTGRRDFDLEALFGRLLQSEAVPGHPFHRYSEMGLTKRKAWEHTWELQRQEDAGKEVTPPVPPKYVQKDFARAEHYKLRGKLGLDHRFTNRPL